MQCSESLPNTVFPGYERNGKLESSMTDSVVLSRNNIDAWSHHYSSGNRHSFYAGRPPWYDCEGNMKEAYVIGLCGGSASGKTTVARNIIRKLSVPWVLTLSLDSFYKVLSEEEHEAAARSEYDFDSPDALDFDLAIRTLRDMKKGKVVEIPIYDFTTHTRIPYKNVVYGASVIVVEGLMTFLPKALLDLLDLKIFVETDSDSRLCRRVIRDISERKRDINSILLQYSRFVKPNFDQYISPLAKCADIVIPWDFYNMPAIEMISQLVKRSLVDRGFIFRSALLVSSDDDDAMLYLNKVNILKQTDQVIALQTIIRDKLTPRCDFIRYSKRLMKLCLIEALSLLPYQDITIHAIGSNSDIPPVERCARSDMKTCAVSIMRAGEAFESVLASTLFNFSIGKLLIQTNERTGEPEFHYLKLPSDIKRSCVILMDATIASGAAAIMAIRILRDHDVPEENIIMVSLILTPEGARSILKVFPKVKIVAAAVDTKITKNYFILPGFGNFGCRYFGF